MGLPVIPDSMHLLRKGQHSAPIQQNRLDFDENGGTLLPKLNRRLPPFAEALGFPSTKGRGLFVSSTVIDSLANGIVFAFLLIYFQQVTVIPLPEIGVAMTVGRLIAIATPPLAGIALDRWGPRKVIIFGNFVSFIGVGISATTTEVWQIAVSQLLIQTGLNFYWTSSRGLVAVAANGEELPRWFGLLGALRNVGIGVGAVVASIFLSLETEILIRSLVALSSLAFIAASILLLLWRQPAGHDLPQAVASKGSGPAEPATEAESGYVGVFRDRRYMLLLGINLVLVFISMVLPLVLALWVVNVAKLNPSWAGALVLVNTTMVAVLSTLTVKMTERKKSTTVLIASFVLSALSFVMMWSAGAVAGQWMAAALLVLFIIIYSISEMLSTPYMNELSLSLAKEDNIGRYQGAFQSSWSLGMAVSPALFAGLLDISPSFLITVLLLICLVAVPMCFALRKKPKMTNTKRPDSIAVLEPFGNVAVSLVRAIRAEGLRVVTVTQWNVVPTLDPEVIKSSDVILLVDFADETVVDEISAALAGQEVVGIISGWEFFSGLVSEVAERLSLPGNDVDKSNLARNKWEMAKAFHESGVRHARTVVAGDANGLAHEVTANSLQYPLVVKPVENAGSVGVSIIQDPSELKAAASAAQAFPTEFPHGFALDNRVLAQEYVGGIEYSVESVAHQGRIHHVAITEKATTGGAHRAELGHIVPARLDEAAIDEVHSEVSRALTTLGFRNGVSHTEVKLWNGKAWIIEAGLRPGGDHIIRLVPLATGVDLAAAYVATSRGNEPDVNPRLDRTAGVQFVSPASGGRTKILAPFPEHPALAEGSFLVKDGDEVGPGVDNISRLAYAIVTSADRHQFDEDIRTVVGQIRIATV
jgi:biotin carboxylase/predicted MFS family arabinose efflux permease